MPVLREWLAAALSALPANAPLVSLCRRQPERGDRLQRVGQPRDLSREIGHAPCRDDAEVERDRFRHCDSQVEEFGVHGLDATGTVGGNEHIFV